MMPTCVGHVGLAGWCRRAGMTHQAVGGHPRPSRRVFGNSTMLQAVRVACMCTNSPVELAAVLVRSSDSLFEVWTDGHNGSPIAALVPLPPAALQEAQPSGEISMPCWQHCASAPRLMLAAWCCVFLVLMPWSQHVCCQGDRPAPRPRIHIYQVPTRLTLEETSEAGLHPGNELQDRLCRR